MTVVAAARLTRLTAAAIRSTGADEDVAACVAAGLVGADIAGVRTHGIAQVPRYLEAVQAGELDPMARPEVVRLAPSAARVRGRWGFGHLAADLATREAIALADANGSSVVALVEAHHIGRMGAFVESAASSGVILLVFGGGQGEVSPSAVPWGGSRAVLHTNPIAIGAPAVPSHPLVVDIATTVMSGLKVREAALAGAQVPLGAIVDALGAPTTDPADFLRGGAHLPFGGHKGYGLMVVAEVLGRIATDADSYAHTDRGGPVLRHAGYMFIGIRTSTFVDNTSYRSRVAALFDRIRRIPPADGFASVQVPGDPEANARAIASSSGIEVDDDVLDRLMNTAVLGGWVDDERAP